MDRADEARNVPGWAIAWLSAPRLAPYEAAAGESDPLALYLWNTHLSAGLLEIVSWFEVLWRNAVDAAITRHRPTTAPHWLLDRAFPLHPPTWAKVDQALRSLNHQGIRRPRPGQVVAELSLGFWRFNAKSYLHTIWTPFLKDMFPHVHPRPHRREVDERLVGIIAMRNRLAHHEPSSAAFLNYVSAWPTCSSSENGLTPRQPNGGDKTPPSKRSSPGSPGRYSSQSQS